MHDSRDDAGFWTAATIGGTGLRIGGWLVLWLAACFLALNYHQLYVDKLAHALPPGEQNLWSGTRGMFNAFKLEDARKARTAILEDHADRTGKSGAPDTQAAGHGAAPAAASPEPHKETAQQAGKQTDKQEPPSIGTLAQAIAALQGNIGKLEQTIEDRTHPPQELPASLFKVLVVVVISLLWFCTFVFANNFKRGFTTWRHARSPFQIARYRRKYQQAWLRQVHAGAPPAPSHARRWRERTGFDWVPGGLKFLLGLLSMLPPLIFVVTMHTAYEPAVFMMALVAIFVAAEHYSGLREAEHELKARTDELKRTMGTVLDADGLYQWKNEVYDLYGKATKRVDAVIREFDIDPEWWKCAGSRDPWDQYRTRCALSSGADTLLSVLTRTRAKVRFVSDQPLELLVHVFVAPAPERKVFFRDLLGLSWQLVVFDMAYQARFAKARAMRDQLRIKISRAPSWMHVVDDTVFQVIERGKEGNATVRQLTYSITDVKERRALSGWAKNSVRRFAQRGGRAEEYVFSVLRYAVLRMKHTEDHRLPLPELLNLLGMQDYLNEPKPDFLLDSNPSDQPLNRSVLLSRSDAQTLCTAVFQELIDRRLGRANCFVEDWANPPDVLVKHLLSELI